MKYNQVTLFVAVAVSVLNRVSAASVTLWVPGPENTDLDTADLPSTPEWMNVIGTASDGGETTYLYNALEYALPVATAADEEPSLIVITTVAETIVVSVSGWKQIGPTYGAECTLSGADSVDCQYEFPADYTGTNLLTTLETGSAVPYVVPILTGAPDGTSLAASGTSATGSERVEPTETAGSPSVPTGTSTAIAQSISRTALTVVSSPTNSVGGASSAADSNVGSDTSASSAASPSVSNGALSGRGIEVTAAGLMVVGVVWGLVM